MEIKNKIAQKKRELEMLRLEKRAADLFEPRRFLALQEMRLFFINKGDILIEFSPNFIALEGTPIIKGVRLKLFYKHNSFNEFFKELEPNKTPLTELKRVWREQYSHLNQADFGAEMNLSPSKISELMSGKKQFSLRIIRFLVAAGADANIMIKEDKNVA